MGTGQSSTSLQNSKLLAVRGTWQMSLQTHRQSTPQAGHPMPAAPPNSVTSTETHRNLNRDSSTTGSGMQLEDTSSGDSGLSRSVPLNSILFLEDGSQSCTRDRSEAQV